VHLNKQNQEIITFDKNKMQLTNQPIQQLVVDAALLNGAPRSLNMFESHLKSRGETLCSTGL